MGIYRIIVVILLIVLQTSQVQAQQITFLDKGQVAKFRGVLLDEKLFLEYESNKDNDMTTETCDLKLSELREKVTVDYEYKLSLKNIELETKTKEFQSRLELKNENIDFLENQVATRPVSTLDKWKFELGVVSGIALTVLLVAVIDEVRFE